jgi:hypothetical protein
MTSQQKAQEQLAFPQGRPLARARQGGGDAVKQQPLFDADRLLGAALLSLVLGIWVTLVHKELRSAPVATGGPAPASYLAGHDQGR